MLLKEITNLLKSQKRTVAVAESCTGGLVSKLLTDLPGSSRYFILGLITYSNQAKAKLLSIPSSTLSRYGAVSKQVAENMARGVRKLARADYGLAITGIAGPAGGSKEKPVGTVYIAIDCGCCRSWKKFQFKGARNSIRKKSAEEALKLLKQCLKK
ncbi:MAG: nicotinamide-nucleotide amidohydrolase family protein [Candidatus Omnitrophica bacterium]|nr:nicotinamide-nucleotide amidohydrolase family protein [Candidatus Omnitrophota bacterium]MDD5611085.1 nicotinamide-nucleotide amidohydrolase family protein [Candidatus Omnitrophota bacterium]